MHSDYNIKGPRREQCNCYKIVKQSAASNAGKITWYIKFITEPTIKLSLILKHFEAC